MEVAAPTPQPIALPAAKGSISLLRDGISSWGGSGLAVRTHPFPSNARG
jgi:hypothetical protein